MVSASQMLFLSGVIWGLKMVGLTMHFDLRNLDMITGEGD